MTLKQPSLARLALGLGLLALALPPFAARADDAPPGPPVDIEAKTASEDQAAVQFYRTSLNKLAVLAKQKEGTAEEPVYLLRIAEAQYKVAALSFRLAHATQAAREGHPDLREYHNSLDQLAKLATRIATRFPRNPQIPRVIYLRAQAEKELEKDAEAIRDFRYLIDNFPQNDDMISAQLAIYDLFTKAKDYKTAIAYLKRYQVPRTENYYPVSLDHLAFANFSLNDIPEALKYLEQELGCFPPSEAAGGGYSEREKILINAVLFYYTGLESKVPNYNVAGALPYFRHLNPGPILAKMIGHFSNLLRSKGRDDDLETFKNLVMNAGLEPSDVAEVLLASMDNSLNKHRYDRLKNSSDELSALVGKLTPEQKKTLRGDKMQKLLSEAASNLNATFLKVKDTPDAAKVTPVLVSIYSLMLRVADNESARQKIEFNLAEIFYGIKKYEAATLHYRWIAELRTPPDKEGQKLQRLARFKSLTARYESLSEQKIFPKEMAAKPFKGASETALPKEATQWVDWIDQYEKGPHDDPADVFQFEASRMLYSAGRIEDAVNRLRSLIKVYPKSSHVIPAESLILDTYVVSEKWEETYQLANEYLKTTEPSKTDFRNKLVEIAGDSYFKTIEQLYKNQAYSDALTRVESFLKMYPASKRRQSCLVLAGNAALALKDKKRALSYFNPLLQAGGASAETQGTALLTTASVAEEKYDFDGAVAAYRRYLALPPKSLALEAPELRNLRIKTLEFAWFSGQLPLLKAVLNTPVVCTADLSEQCERFAALVTLADPAHATDRNATNRAWDRAQKAPETTRAIWAAIALDNVRGLSFNNRLKLFDIVATTWNKADPLARFALLPTLSASIPAALKQASAEIRQMSRLKLEKPALDKRTHLIEKMEDGVAKILDLPWQRLRVTALSAMAALYSDFSTDLAALPAPAGLAGDDLKTYNQTIAELREPFQKKADELRKQAMDAGSDAGVEAEAYNLAAIPYAAEHPQAAGQPKPTFSVLKEPIAGLELLDALKPPAPFGTLAAGAVRAGNWGLLAFLIQEAKDKSLMNDAQLAATRGISLSLAGAQAESLVELKDAATKLDKPARYFAKAAIAAAYAGVRNKSKAKAAIEEFISDSSTSWRKSALRPDLARELAEAGWSGAEISNGTREELAETGRHPRAPASQPKGK